MRLQTTSDKNATYNFNLINQEIKNLKKSVGNYGDTSGIAGKKGDIRFIKGANDAGYLEYVGDDDVYTSATGIFRRKQRGRQDLKLDSLYVDNLYATQFTARQINAANGDYIFSDNAIIKAVRGTQITFVDANNVGVCPFAVNDLIVARTVNINTKADITYVKATVNSVSGNTVTVAYTSTNEFRPGQTVVRVGNTTDSTRRDSIYISTNLNHTPYMDVYDSVSSFSAWDAPTPKARIGKLTGINDPDFGGALSGYGIYTQNAYIKGTIIIQNPEANGIIKVYRQTTAPTGTITTGSFWSDTDDKFRMYYYDGASWIDYIPGFGSASSSGLALTGAYMGFYNGTTWKTYTDNLGNFFLTSNTSSTDYLQWSNSVLTIKGDLVIRAASGYGNISDKPTNLNGINTIEGDKLTGIAAGATVGATWGTNLNSIPTRFSNAETTAGLYLTGSYLGFYDGTAWKAYITSTGNFYFGGTASNYIEWNGTTLTVRGAINADDITAGTITGRTLRTSASGERVEVSNANTISFYTTSGLAAFIGNSGGYGIFSTHNPTTSEYSRFVWSGLDFYSSSGFAAASINQLGTTIRSGTTGAVQASLQATGVVFYYATGATTIGVAGLQISNASGTKNFEIDSGGNIVEWGDKSVSTTYASGQYLQYNGTSFVWATPSGGGSGTVTSVATTAPITGGTITTTGTIGITQATSLANGYVSSVDWNTFNNKVATTRTISTTAPLSGGGDLSANRTLSLSYGNGLALSGSTLVAQGVASTGISVTASGIQLNSGNGLAISGGTTLIVSANATHFTFNAGTLELNQVPTAKITGTWGANTPASIFAAPSSGGSTTMALGYVAVTLGATTYNLVYK